MASCVGCKFLYTEGDGYSNYTWLDDIVNCAKGRNPLLDERPSRPYDWTMSPEADNWPKTKDSRCELYAEGPLIGLDVDGEDGPAEYTDDQEQIDAICEHSGRPPKGRR